MAFRPATIAIIGATIFQTAQPACAADMAVTGAIAGPDGGWDYASVDPEGRKLFVAHGDAVMEVDLDSGNVNASLVGGKRLHAVVPLPGGKALSTNGGADNATIFEAATGKIVATVPTGASPDAAIYDPSSALVLVMDGKSIPRPRHRRARSTSAASSNSRQPTAMARPSSMWRTRARSPSSTS
jgi:DNA-binding beta-propeller fold protein YncE